MSLLSKALAQREAAADVVAAEGRFYRDTALLRQRLLLVVLAFLLLVAAWFAYRHWPTAAPVAAKLPVVAAPAAKVQPVPMPALAQDPFFAAPKAMPKAPLSQLPVSKVKAPEKNAGSLSIAYSAHFYASTAAQRYVIFNGHKLREGERLGGIKVLRIGPNSTEVAINGKTFWLDALVNWPLQP